LNDIIPTATNDLSSLKDYLISSYKFLGLPSHPSLEPLFNNKNIINNYDRNLLNKEVLVN
jgi:hypothetical protein